MDKKLNLKNDKEHATESHSRWMKRLNRNTASPDYKDEWYSEQCYACQYYMHIDGYLRTDWGVCSHPESPFDGKLMFEHDGCEYFSPVDEEDEELIELTRKLMDEINKEQSDNESNSG
jgi:hypothetical protein